MSLRTIAARQVWDGRKARGGSGFIPGIRHFQAGVLAYRAEAARGDDEAAARLGEIRNALDAVDQSLVRWRRGLAGFASGRLPGKAVTPNGRRWRRSGRLLRIRAQETRRLAALIEGYDDACANTATVTAACRRSGISNPHRASVADRRRRLRTLIEMGYGGVRLRSEQPRRGSERFGQDTADGRSAEARMDPARRGSARSARARPRQGIRPTRRSANLPGVRPRQQVLDRQ